MNALVDQFLQVLIVEKGFSGNTQAAYRNDLHQLGEYLQQVHHVQSWPEVSREHLTSYLLVQREKGYSMATLARKVASLKSFFEYLAHEGIINDDPTEDIASPKLGRRLPKPLTEAEMTSLLATTMADNEPESLRDRAILELLYATGMRVSELASLDVEQVVLTAGNGSVKCYGKGGKERMVQIHDSAVAAINRYLSEGRTKLVKDEQEHALFVNRRGERLTRQGCWLILKEYARRAGVTGHVTPHALRHSFATHMLRGGATLRQVQEWLGHASITTTQVYTLLTDQHLQDAYDRAHPRAKAS
jgi:integrase/recombinase XerD